ncbi:MAG: type III pantothenate kinase [Armatimonadetes bacterium]|jgi:type III pantothenate kinase|nr:type III pantothenate kinase [Armatimonadota bacterium]
MKLLALDVGNTNLVPGVFEGERLVASWRLSTDRGRTADEYGALLTLLLTQAGISPGEIGGVALCNVVPPLALMLDQLLARYFAAPVLKVDHTTDTGLRICYEPPGDVGADRIVDAAAAYHLRGGPCIVVDFGTATTFNVVTEAGDYLGGAIAPGIGTSLDALFARAARLPRIDLVRPPRVIGRTTRESMQSGIIFGFAGYADAVVTRMRAELGPQTRVIATGGLASLIAPETETIQEVRPNLTLEGLELIWRRQAGRLPAPASTGSA